MVGVAAPSRDTLSGQARAVCPKQPSKLTADLRPGAEMGKSTASESLVQGNGRFQFEVPWVRYNAQFLHPPLSCHHEPALKGLLRNCKTKDVPKLTHNFCAIFARPIDSPNISYQPCTHFYLNMDIHIYLCVDSNEYFFSCD